MNTLAAGLLSCLLLAGCASPGDDRLDSLLIRDRILRLYGNDDDRDGARRELVVIGRPAVGAFQGVLRKEARDGRLGIPWKAWNAALVALVGIEGPAEALTRLIDNPGVLSRDALPAFADRFGRLDKADRARATGKVGEAIRSADPWRRLSALQVAAIAFEKEFPPLSTYLEFRNLVAQGPMQDAASRAFLETDASTSKVSDEGIAVLGEILKRERWMKDAMLHVSERDKYNMFGPFDRFVPIIRELFVARLTVRDRISWVGGPFFLEGRIIKAVRDNWERVNPRALFVEQSLDLTARLALVEYMAVAAGKKTDEELWSSFHSLDDYDPQKIKTAILQAYPEAKEEPLRRSILRWFPELVGGK